MEMLSATVLWFVAALVMAGVEMFVGTIYLIAVAIGAAAGGAVSFFGGSLAVQFAVCAVVIVVLSVLIRRMRAARTGNADSADRLQRIDEGNLVRVESVGSDGLAVVQYRGAPWIARPGGEALRPGFWTIERVDGVQLVLGQFVR